MKSTTLLLSAALLVGPWPVRADVLELKNGNLVSGKYAGGTAGTVRFETSAGLQVFETAQVISLTFTSPAAAVPAAAPTPAPAPAAPAPAPAASATVPAAATPAPAAAPVATSVTLPSGTTLLVRMMDGASSRSQTGARFTTKLEYQLVVDGVVAAPAGTVIYGKVNSATQARRALGTSTLDLRLAQMIIAGSPVPLTTSAFQEAGEASIKKAARGAAAGAAIGAIVDGGDGAGKGAAIGATASLLKKGQSVTIPPGALLEFTLTQPVTLRVAK